MALGSCQHTIHEHQHHHAWDRDLPPALTVADGASVEFDTTDASGGQLGPDSTAGSFVTTGVGTDLMVGAWLPHGIVRR